MSTTIFWKDGDGRCHWCLRPAKSIMEGHDGMCPVPYAAQLEAERDEWKHYAQHLPYCGTRNGFEKCSCNFDALKEGQKEIT